MILYVNGDSHSAGAEAVNLYCFAEDDSRFWQLGRRAHPDNLQVSYGQILANMLEAELICEAESSSSVSRIIRTTDLHLTTKQNRPDLIIIGWPTFEREEWIHENTWLQVTASGHDHMPKSLHNKYKAWVIEQNDPMVINSKIMRQHRAIHDLHSKFLTHGINHYFFNTYSHFGNIKNLRHLDAQEFEWSGCYLEPYDPQYTYYNWLTQNGYKTVRPDSYHFGPDAHRAWADFLFQNLVRKGLTT